MAVYNLYANGVEVDVRLRRRRKSLAWKRAARKPQLVFRALRLKSAGLLKPAKQGEEPQL